VRTCQSGSCHRHGRGLEGHLSRTWERIWSTLLMVVLVVEHQNHLALRRLVSPSLGIKTQRYGSGGNWGPLHGVIKKGASRRGNFMMSLWPLDEKPSCFSHLFWHWSTLSSIFYSCNCSRLEIRGCLEHPHLCS
jgi:hypothetical protein